MTKKRSRAARLDFRGTGLWWTFIAALILATAIIVAIAQNVHSVEVHYLVWHTRVSLIVIILATAVVAIALDQVGGLVWRRRRRLRLGRRAELQQLRAQRTDGERPAASAAPERSPETERESPGKAD